MKKNNQVRANTQNLALTHSCHTRATAPKVYALRRIFRKYSICVQTIMSKIFEKQNLIFMNAMRGFYSVTLAAIHLGV